MVMDTRTLARYDARAQVFKALAHPSRLPIVDQADRLLVVDGCDSDCARKTMELGGFTGFIHLRVSDLGMEKGKTPVTGERIGTVASKLRELLARA
jgi:uncharacterized metal-binding protein